LVLVVTVVSLVALSSMAEMAVAGVPVAVTLAATLARAVPVVVVAKRRKRPS
jgi:hypothetical protein